MKTVKESFGKLPDGSEAFLFTLENDNGMKVGLTTYGAAIVSINLPEGDGEIDVVAGPKDLAGFLEIDCYFGAVIGRVANRIGWAKFKIDDTEYTVDANREPHHLHGGDSGFNYKNWEGSTFESNDSIAVRFMLNSPDMEGGYPGNLQVAAVYSLDNENRLRLELSAMTDKPTVVDMTNHVYLNLRGGKSGETIKKMNISIDASKTLGVDEDIVVNGDILDVEGTAFDLREGASIAEVFEKSPEGVDNFFLLDKSSEEGPDAVISDPESGRTMRLYTIAPGLQFYTGNFLDGSAQSSGTPLNGALCLEPHRNPNSINVPSFPSVILREHETYRNSITYAFEFAGNK